MTEVFNGGRSRHQIVAPTDIQLTIGGTMAVVEENKAWRHRGGDSDG